MTFKSSIIVSIISSFIFSTVNPALLQAQPTLYMPAPGTMVALSPKANPPLLKGIKVYPDNPFKFDFILDKGGAPENQDLKDESTKLIKYFLASLTTPEKDLWVNLSPYEKDRIVPENFGQTEMGRDLLGQDYLLKQVTASLVYPEGGLGKRFWKKIYEITGNKNIAVNTFNKVWIVPDKAVVYENAQNGTAYVVGSGLKVLTEEDYLATAKNNTNSVNNQVVRDIVVPQLTNEINTGANFAALRQVYNSLVLAAWYKKKIKDSILAKVYCDRNKIEGIKANDDLKVNMIYDRYLQAFKKGAYNYIKDEQDPVSMKMVPKKYFSGGLNLSMAMLTITVDKASVAANLKTGIVLETTLTPIGVRFEERRRFLRLSGAALARSTLGLGLTLAGKGRLINETSAQELKSVGQMRAWLDNNLFEGYGLPRIYQLPEDSKARRALWGSIVDKDPLKSLIERTIINDGLSVYDGALWQITQAFAGNIAAADKFTDMLASGSFGELNDIRGWDPKYFNYQGRLLTNKHQGLFFRIISPRWKQLDPLNGSREYLGFPGFDGKTIVWNDWQPITGENAWLIIGLLQTAFLKYKGDKGAIKNSREFKIAESIVEAFELLTSPIGAIYYAPAGTYGKDFDPSVEISTENNLSAYAAIRMMYEVTRDEKYLKKMGGIENYLRNYAWDKTQGFFRQGGNYKDNRFAPNPPFALDVNTWAIDVLGPEKIDAWFGSGASMKIWQTTVPFGWWANPIESTASTAWPLLILTGVDPFVLGGKSKWSFSEGHLELIKIQRQLDKAMTANEREKLREEAGELGGRLTGSVQQWQYQGRYTKGRGRIGAIVAAVVVAVAGWYWANRSGQPEQDVHGRQSTAVQNMTATPKAETPGLNPVEQIKSTIATSKPENVSQEAWERWQKLSTEQRLEQVRILSPKYFRKALVSFLRENPGFDGRAAEQEVIKESHDADFNTIIIASDEWDKEVRSRVDSLFKQYLGSYRDQEHSYQIFSAIRMVLNDYADFLENHEPTMQEFLNYTSLISFERGTSGPESSEMLYKFFKQALGRLDEIADKYGVDLQRYPLASRLILASDIMNGDDASVQYKMAQGSTAIDFDLSLRNYLEGKSDARLVLTFNEKTFSELRKLPFQEITQAIDAVLKWNVGNTFYNMWGNGLLDLIKKKQDQRGGSYEQTIKQLVDERKNNLQKSVSDKQDNAQAGKVTKGGIDFNTQKMDMKTQSYGGNIRFNIDPAMLKELEDSTGFTPIVTNIQRMTDLPKFLGI